MNFLSRFFKQSLSSGSTEETSKNVAKERLKLALTYDRGGLAHGTIEQLRDEIIDIIAKHLDISEEDIEINFDSSAEYGKLIASIPLRAEKRSRPAAVPAAQGAKQAAAVTRPLVESPAPGPAPKVSKKRRHRS